MDALTKLLTWIVGGIAAVVAAIAGLTFIAEAALEYVATHPAYDTAMWAMAIICVLLIGSISLVFANLAAGETPHRDPPPRRRNTRKVFIKN